MRALVLEPLGMQHSYLFPKDVLTHRFVVGHASPFGADEPVRVMRDWPLSRATHAAGGLISCVPDLLRYVRFWLGRGPSAVLSDRSRQFMLGPLVEAGNFAEACGLAWMLRTVDSVRIVGHGGSTVGQQAQLTLVPERQCGIVSLANSNRGAELHLEVRRWFLRERLGLSEADEPRIELAPDALAEYAGVYEAALNRIDVTAIDDGLRVQVHSKGGFPYADSPPSPAPPPSRFEFVGPDRIRGLDPPLTDSLAEFIREGDGQIAWLRIGGRLARRQSPSP
jgi:CubicO group peptidase (beta-lactamase class C family)